MKQEITCIGCPMGCLISASLEEGTIKELSGYTCEKGRLYALKELVSPSRVLTSTVPVKGGAEPLLSIKSKADLPKDMLLRCMEELKTARVTAPVRIGDVVVHNIAGTGIDMVATKNVDKTIAT